jgi:peptidyl-prolyl cis-trans isomerase B (cyclophilin B)
MRSAGLLSACLIATALSAAGCGGGGGTEQSAGASGCRKVSTPPPKKVHLKPPSAQVVHPGKKLTAVVKTSCGTFSISLDTKRAPKTTNSFVYLVRKGFYEGLSFQRIVPRYIIQGGDPRENDTGGPGYTIDEPPPPNLSYTKGVVAMAKTQVEPPGRSGSQFFIVTVPAIPLNPDYALLGRVSSGKDVVARIAHLGTGTGEPSQPVRIDRITVRKGR